MSFDLGKFLKSINYDKNYLIENEEDMSSYVPFLINRSMSYFPDTLWYAVEIAKYGGCTNSLHYIYWLESVKKRKRFSKWYKPKKENMIEIIQKIYKVNRFKATEYMACMNENQLKHVENVYKSMNQ